MTFVYIFIVTTKIILPTKTWTQGNVIEWRNIVAYFSKKKTLQRKPIEYCKIEWRAVAISDSLIWVVGMRLVRSFQCKNCVSTVVKVSTKHSLSYRCGCCTIRSPYQMQCKNMLSFFFRFNSSYDKNHKLLHANSEFMTKIPCENAKRWVPPDVLRSKIQSLDTIRVCFFFGPFVHSLRLQHIDRIKGIQRNYKNEHGGQQIANKHTETGIVWKIY